MAVELVENMVVVLVEGTDVELVEGMVIVGNKVEDLILDCWEDIRQNPQVVD